MKQIEKNDVKIPMETNISDYCRDLLLKLLQKELEKIISCPQFFTHPWLDS